MKNKFVIIFLITFKTLIYPQKESGNYKHSISLNAGGASYYYSIDYTVKLMVSNKFFISSSLGFGSLPFKSNYISIPLKLKTSYSLNSKLDLEYYTSITYFKGLFSYSFIQPLSFLQPNYLFTNALQVSYNFNKNKFYLYYGICLIQNLFRSIYSEYYNSSNKILLVRSTFGFGVNL